MLKDNMESLFFWIIILPRYNVSPQLIETIMWKDIPPVNLYSSILICKRLGVGHFLHDLALGACLRTKLL